MWFPSLVKSTNFYFVYSVLIFGTSPAALVVKNLLANAGDIRDEGSIPRLGRSPGGGHGNPLLHSRLGNPMDRGAWWITVLMVALSRTLLKRFSRHAQPHTYF